MTIHRFKIIRRAQEMETVAGESATSASLFASLDQDLVLAAVPVPLAFG